MIFPIWPDESKQFRSAATGSDVSFLPEGIEQIYLKEIRKRRLDFYKMWIENDLILRLLFICKVLPKEEISISWRGLLD